MIYLYCSWIQWWLKNLTERNFPSFIYTSIKKIKNQVINFPNFSRRKPLFGQTIRSASPFGHDKRLAPFDPPDRSSETRLYESQELLLFLWSLCTKRIFSHSAVELVRKILQRLFGNPNEVCCSEFSRFFIVSQRIEIAFCCL